MARPRKTHTASVRQEAASRLSQVIDLRNESVVKAREAADAANERQAELDAKRDAQKAANAVRNVSQGKAGRSAAAKVSSENSPKTPEPAKKEGA